MWKLIVRNRYATIPNVILNSKELSLKAKWLRWYIQSKPDWRNFSAAKIANEIKEWIDSITGWLKELEIQGLLKRQKHQDTRWHREIDYILLELEHGEILYGENHIKENPQTIKEIPIKKVIYNYREELSAYIEKWNNVKPFGVIKKWLPKIKKLSDPLLNARIKKRKDYEVDEIESAIKNYIKYVKSLKVPLDWWTFYQHRFDMLTFLKQSNGLDKYINM